MNIVRKNIVVNFCRAEIFMKIRKSLTLFHIGNMNRKIRGFAVIFCKNFEKIRCNGGINVV